MSDNKGSLAIQLFSELLAVDHSVRGHLSRVLPKGMEISHFSVLNVLARRSQERTPAQLAQTFNVTRGAMTNTLNKLEQAGLVRPGTRVIGDNLVFPGCPAYFEYMAANHHYQTKYYDSFLEYTDIKDTYGISDCVKAFK